MLGGLRLSARAEEHKRRTSGRRRRPPRGRAYRATRMGTDWGTDYEKDGKALPLKESDRRGSDSNPARMDRTTVYRVR